MAVAKEQIDAVDDFRENNDGRRVVRIDDLVDEHALKVCEDVVHFRGDYAKSEKCVEFVFHSIDKCG